MRLVESDDEWAAPAPGGGFDAEADDEAPQVVFDDAEGAAFSSAPGPIGASTAPPSPATARSATRNAAVAARRRA